MPLSSNKQRRASVISTALSLVQDGASIRKAAVQHNIPPTTLHRHLTCTVSTSRRHNALTEKEEELVIDYLIDAADLGSPATDTQVRDAVDCVTKRMGPARRLFLPFKHHTPSDSSIRAFRTKHKERIKFLRPLRQESLRFRAMNGTTIANHFAVLTHVIEKIELTKIASSTLTRLEYHQLLTLSKERARGAGYPAEAVQHLRKRRC